LETLLAVWHAAAAQPVPDGMEAIAERPDGTRVSFISYPTPLFDESEN
jgi:hypothetical protein